MESRGLKFAGSATVFLNMADLAVPEPLHDEFRTLTSRAELEAKRDFIRNETFRRGVWVKGDPVTSEEERLALNAADVCDTLKPLAEIDHPAMFGNVKMTDNGDPFDKVLATLSAAGRSISGMGAVAGLDALPPSLRIEDACLLAAGRRCCAVCAIDQGRHDRSGHQTDYAGN